ncbi:MAG: hypothetical protein N3A58_00360 [Spirochaetes bacterium]|nr:hypothetical protein [Spirochaetota bacterium]
MRKNFFQNYFIFFISVFLLLFVNSILLSLNISADNSNDELNIISKIIETEDEKELLAIIDKYKDLVDENSILYTGIAYHNLAINNSPKYSELAVSTLSKYKGTKYKYLAMGYLGSSVTLVGNALAMKNNLIGASMKLSEGFKLLDESVKNDKDNLILRFLRAENGISITESTPFSREKVIEEDLNYIYSKFSSISNTSKAQYYLILGRLRIFQKKLKEGIKALKDCIAVAPDSKHAKVAKKILQKYED